MVAGKPTWSLRKVLRRPGKEVGRRGGDPACLDERCELRKRSDRRQGADRGPRQSPDDSHFGTNLRSTLAGSSCHIAPLRASTPKPAAPKSALREKSTNAWSDCRVVPLATPAI